MVCPSSLTQIRKSVSPNQLRAGRKVNKSSWSTSITVSGFSSINCSSTPSNTNCPFSGSVKTLMVDNSSVSTSLYSNSTLSKEYMSSSLTSISIFSTAGGSLMGLIIRVKVASKLLFSSNSVSSFSSFIWYSVAIISIFSSPFRSCWATMVIVPVTSSIDNSAKSITEGNKR